MVKQYPYTLQVLSVTGGGFDVDGNPQPTLPAYTDATKCRDESNSGARKVDLIDGTAYVYEAAIFMPLIGERLKIGDQIRIVSGEGIRLEKTVKHYREDQLHRRAWV